MKYSHSVFTFISEFGSGIEVQVLRSSIGGSGIEVQVCRFSIQLNHPYPEDLKTWRPKPQYWTWMLDLNSQNWILDLHASIPEPQYPNLNTQTSILNLCTVKNGFSDLTKAQIGRDWQGKDITNDHQGKALRGLLWKKEGLGKCFLKREEEHQ